MPGANCSIFGCGTNRRHTGVGIFRIPSGNDERSKVIRDEWIRVITKDRVDVLLMRIFVNKSNLATFMCARDILRRWRSNVVSIKQFS
jgi:hypothetical protein